MGSGAIDSRWEQPRLWAQRQVLEAADLKPGDVFRRYDYCFREYRLYVVTASVPISFGVLAPNERETIALTSLPIRCYQGACCGKCYSTEYLENFEPLLGPGNKLIPLWRR